MTHEPNLFIQIRSYFHEKRSNGPSVESEISLREAVYVTY